MSLRLTNYSIAFIIMMIWFFLYSFAIVLSGDFLIYSKSKEDHANNFYIIWGFHGKQKLYSKFSKCEFKFLLGAFLRHVTVVKWVMVDPEMIEVVKDTIRPSFMTEVRMFVPLATSYSRFVMFTSIDMHLTWMTQKELPFMWSEH